MFKKDEIGDGTHFHMVSFCPHRLSKSFTEAWTKKDLYTPVLLFGQLFSETVNSYNTGENQSHLETKRVAEATVS